MSKIERKGISLVALVITIIVLVVLTGAVVITGVNVPQQGQLAVFKSNVSSIQDAVTLKWDKSNTPQIYKLDYKEQQVYQYNADGSYTILDWIQD